MLTERDGDSFTTSRTSYSDSDPEARRRQSGIYLQVVLPFALGLSVYALVDSGAPYCIFDSDLMVAGGIDFAEGEAITLSTRVGLVSGALQRLPLIVPAEHGNPLAVDATVLVSDQWRHGHFLGYGGFLERLRFAVDPVANTWHFGPAD